MLYRAAVVPFMLAGHTLGRSQLANSTYTFDGLNAHLLLPSLTPHFTRVLSEANRYVIQEFPCVGEADLKDAMKELEVRYRGHLLQMLSW